MDGVVDRDLVGTEAPHPGLHDVVVQTVEGDLLLPSAVLKDELPDFVLESVHLAVHVLRSQQREGKVLPEAMRDLLHSLAPGWPQVGGKMKLLDLRDDVLGEVKTETGQGLT